MQKDKRNWIGTRNAFSTRKKKKHFGAEMNKKNCATLVTQSSGATGRRKRLQPCFLVGGQST